MKRWIFTVMILLVAETVAADQRVDVSVNATMDQVQISDRAFALAVGREAEAILGAALPERRLKLFVDLILPDRTAYMTGIRQVANATNSTAAMDVQLDEERLKDRLQETGIYYTISAPMTYGLLTGGLEPAKTKRLGPLQELTGVRPAGGGGPETPSLKLEQDGAGVWTGVLSQGAWSETKSGKSLDTIWLGLWKSYFSRAEVRGKVGTGIQVTVSGWVSSMGPMEFDKLMDGWSAEIEHKTLEKVGMDAGGVIGVWQIQSRRPEALQIRLKDSVRAQGLQLEMK